MFKRIVLAAALLVAPLVLTPTSVDAQERGMAEATAATANAQATGRPDAAPEALQNRPGDEPPPGIMLTRGGGAAAEEPPPEDDSGDDDGCQVIGFDPITGEPIFDCGGTQ